MSNVESRVEVFKEPFECNIWAETSDTITGVVPGIAVGVRLDGEEVWVRDVYPIVMPLRNLLSVEVHDPFFERKIAKAERKANKIAKTLT